MYSNNRTKWNSCTRWLSPATFTLLGNQPYTVQVEDYGNYVFDHWNDGTTTRLHDVITGNSTTTSLVAVYRTAP